MSDNRPPHYSWELVEADEDASVPVPRRHSRLPGDPLAEEESRGPEIKRYLAAVLRHKWLILLLVIAGTSAGVYAAGHLPEEYQAQATVWIETTDGGVDRGPIRTNELLRSNAWIELLRSFVVLDDVVRTERLYLKPHNPADSLLFASFSLQPEQRFAPGTFRLAISDDGRTYRLSTAEGVQVEQGSTGDRIGESLGYSWQPDPSVLTPGRRADFEVMVPRERAVELNRQLQTRIDQNANFLRLELRMPTAGQAASVLNAVTERYVEVAETLKRSRLDERTAILEEQLQYSEQSLAQAERELQGFKVNTATLPSERSTPVVPGLQMTQDPVMSGFFNMKVELEQLRRDRESIERALGGDGEPVTTARLEVIPAVSGSSEMTSALAELNERRAELRALLYDYTDEHPPVRRLRETIQELEQRTIPSVAQKLMAQLRSREQVLAEMIDEAGVELQQIPPRAIEEARLERRVAIAERLYTNLQERVEESRLAAASAIADISILDEATVPQNPVRDEKPRLILLALVGSLGLGVLGAILRERIDPTIRYPNQVIDQLGVGVLGAIPFIKGNGKGAAQELTETTEAFRGIRMNLAHAHGAGPLITTISSPGPGDGKSFVAANLAVSFAGLGKRTLLIDGDIRKGTLHQLLSRARTPGLSDYLGGDAALSDIIHATDYQGLDLICSGRRRSDGPELIDSRQMRQLILEMRTEYDVILVDSAPLGAGVDPFVLGTLTGSMLLILRTGETQQALAEAKLGLLERLPVRLLGAVLNGIRSKDGAYPYYQYYSYMPGYEATDEAIDAPEPRALVQKT